MMRQREEKVGGGIRGGVAVERVRGTRAGLDRLVPMQADQRITGSHRFHAVRAHLLEMAGDRAAARTAYLDAAGLTASLPHQRYLHAQVTRLGGDAQARCDLAREQRAETLDRGTGASMS